MNGSADWILISKNLSREIPSNQANLVVLLHVVRIKIPSSQNEEVADILVALRDSDKGDRVLDAIHNDCRVDAARTGDLNYSGNRVSNSFHVRERDFVTQRSGFPESMRCRSVNDV